MSHLSDDELALVHFGEGEDDEVQAHARDCAECAERLRALARLLSLAEPPVVPERGEDYGARVWERLSPLLAGQKAPARVVPIGRRAWPRVASYAALAAALVLSFLLGRRFPETPQPLSAEARERVLLVAVSEHLERSQLVLVELANARTDAPLALGARRTLADELVASGRLYRQAAARADEPALAAVLEELERVLVEVAAGPEALAPRDLAELQRRIEARGLLFKVRVIGTQVRERERGLLPSAGTTSS